MTEDMITIYRLKLDKRAIQEATGIKPTHGVFGSPEWWQSIKDGTLPVQHLRGIISRITDENDWPEFTLRTEEGQEIEWSRYANDPDFADVFYTVGRPIEIDYVIQWFEYNENFDPTLRYDEVPIEIRVGEDGEKVQN
jgi:hypothetical protein